MRADKPTTSNVQEPRTSDAMLSAQLSLFCLRAAQTFDHVIAGRMHLLDAADMLADAACSSGLTASVGHNSIQKCLAAAFASASASRDRAEADKRNGEVAT